MSVENTTGYIVGVPEGNGYTRTLFVERVVGHLEQATGASINVPLSGTIVELPRTQQQDLNQSEHSSDDKTFGVLAHVRGNWWDEVYRTQGNVIGIMQQHYGLDVTPARVTYGNNGIQVMFTPYPSDEETNT